MKIAIIGPCHPYRGGIASYNERLAQQFQREGHEVILYTFSLQYPSILFPGKTQFSGSPKPTDLNIKRVINSVNPLSWIGTGNTIAKEKFDMVIVRYWLPFMGPSLGTILRRIRKRSQAKIINLVDNIIPHESRIGDKIFTRYFVKPIDAFVAMSQNVYDDISQFDQEKPKILSPHPLFDHYGEIESREKALSHLGLDPEHKYIMFFGLIRKYKGLDLLLEAFGDKRFDEKNIKLIIAGEYYDDKEEYQKIIDKHGMQNRIIDVNSYIPDHEVAHYFNASDMIVQPYHNATQSGVTQIAYHFNKPMIVTNVGGLSEMCPDGKVGYVVDKKPGEIADAIIKFYDENKEQEMRDFIEEEKKKYSWEILTQRFIKLIESLD